MKHSENGRPAPFHPFLTSLVHFFRPFRLGVLLALALMVTGCPPDNTPLLQENDRLSKQAQKQDSMISTLQEGARVLQQQIDLLNQELRESKKELAEAKDDLQQGQQLAYQKDAALLSDKKKLTNTVAKLKKENSKLAKDAQWLRTQRTLFRQSIQAGMQNPSTQTLNHTFSRVIEATSQALSAHGYPILASMSTDLKAVLVTERKISLPPSLELQGFRNQYLLIIEKHTPKTTLIQVKADFEKMAQPGTVQAPSPEEIQNLEIRLIGEITSALEKS